MEKEGKVPSESFKYDFLNSEILNIAPHSLFHTSDFSIGSKKEGR